MSERVSKYGRTDFCRPLSGMALGKIGAEIARARYVGRFASKSPAVGVMPLHMGQLASFQEEAFAA